MILYINVHRLFSIIGGLVGRSLAPSVEGRWFEIPVRSN